ncbi:MAG: division/cell wall cluster transcriptional repressor MraZ [Deltaproteobacteria bacterium]|nr:division/cell wall cluster transcriptional repressor MraZ [Deltaproteobacteria bacterium]
MFFRGLFEHSIDGKGRTSVPARFREVLLQSYGERLVVTFGFTDDPAERFLGIYPLKNWEEIEAQLARRNQSDPGVKEIYRTYVANAFEVEVDKLGRVLLPPNLRAHAALEKEVVWVGQGKRMHLWSQADWTRAQSAASSADRQKDAAQVWGEIGG